MLQITFLQPRRAVGLFCLLAFAVKDCPASGKYSESQESWGGKAPWQLSSPNPCLSRAGCHRLYTAGFWTSLRLESLWHLWATYSYAWPPSLKKGSFLFWMEFPVFLFAPIVSWLVSGYHREGPGPNSFRCPPGIHTQGTAAQASCCLGLISWSWEWQLLNIQEVIIEIIN